MNVEYQNILQKAIELAGGGGWYQKRTIILLALQQIIQAFILQGQPFLFMAPDFKCKQPDGKFKMCEEKEACQLYNNNITKNELWNNDNTLVVNFELYCSRNYLIGLTQFLYFALSNISILIFTFYSDKYGRKPVIIIGYLIGSFPILIGGFSWIFYFFMVMLIISGLGLNPYSIIIFVLMQEQSNESFRSKSTIYLLSTWGIGQIIFVGVAYWFRSWDVLIIFFMGIPLVVQNISFMFIYESVKWLVSSKKYNDARKVLVKIAQVNGKNQSTISHLENGFQFDLEVEQIQQQGLMNWDQMTKSQKRRTQKKYTVYHLFKYKSCRYPTIALCVTYFAIYLQYYGSIFALKSLGSNKFFNATLLNITELCSYILAIPVVKKLPRKISFPGVFGIMMLTSILFLVVESQTSKVVLGILAKISVSISFSISYVYGPELYATPIRGNGIGFTTFVGKFGGAAAPIIILISDKININPMATFGIFTTLALIFSLFLQETQGTLLSDVIPEDSLVQSPNDNVPKI